MNLINGLLSTSYHKKSLSNLIRTSESVDPLTPLTHACTETRQEQVHISIDYDLRMLYYHIGLL